MSSDIGNCPAHVLLDCLDAQPCPGSYLLIAVSIDTVSEKDFARTRFQARNYDFEALQHVACLKGSDGIRAAKICLVTAHVQVRDMPSPGTNLIDDQVSRRLAQISCWRLNRGWHRNRARRQSRKQLLHDIRCILNGNIPPGKSQQAIAMITIETFQPIACPIRSPVFRRQWIAFIKRRTIAKDFLVQTHGAASPTITPANLARKKSAPNLPIAMGILQLGGHSHFREWCQPPWSAYCRL